MLHRLLFAPCVLSIVVIAAGCGGSDDTATGSGGSTTSSGSTGGAAGSGGSGGSGGAGAGPFMTAPHAPILLKEHGQGVFDAPELVTITFSGFDKTAFVQSFGDWVVTSDYFTTAMTEYGVGAATHLAKVELTDAPPLSDHALLQLLEARMADGTLPSPADHPQAVYMTYFPKGTMFDDDGPLCGAFDGYHSWDEAMGNRFVYAIIGECDGMINTASHELAESATDPFNGWYTDGTHLDPWHWVQDDEIADLCEYYPSVTVETWPIARLWSNAAAVANQDPCLPVPANDPPFKSVDAAPATLQTVARGMSTTFTLTGWSTAPTPPWALLLDHATYYPNDVGAFKAKATLSKKTIGNGEKVTLTVEVPADAQVGALGMIGIYSDKRYAEQAYVGVIAQ